MSINYIPEQENYKKLSPFKMWVAQSFPYIEADFDAINEYTLLSKVVDYLNIVIENENAVEENVNNLYNAYVSLHNYVNNYFGNLDVQDEINNKLNNMAQDGTLTKLIKGYVDPFIEEQNEDIEEFETTVRTQINDFDSRLKAVASGSPKNTYPRIEDLRNANPETGVYVVTANGHLFAWTKNQSGDPVDLGVYQATGIADDSVKYQMLDDFLKDDLYEINDYSLPTTFDYGSISNGVGVPTDIAMRSNDFIKFNNKIIITSKSNYRIKICKYNEPYTSTFINETSFLTGKYVIEDLSKYYRIVIATVDQSQISSLSPYDKIEIQEAISTPVDNKKSLNYLAKTEPIIWKLGYINENGIPTTETTNRYYFYAYSKKILSVKIKTPGYRLTLHARDILTGEVLGTWKGENIGFSDTGTTVWSDYFDLNKIRNKYNCALYVLLSKTSNAAITQEETVDVAEKVYIEEEKYNACDYGLSSQSGFNRYFLRTLVEHVSENGGGTIFIPNGEYNFINDINVRKMIEMKSNVSIVGESRENTKLIMVDSETEYNLFERVGTSQDDSLDNCTFENFTIDASETTFGGSGESGKAFFGKYLKNCIFRNLKLIGLPASAIGVDFLKDCIIDSNLLINCGKGYDPDDHLRKEGHAGIGIGTGGYDDENLIITNNICINCGNYGIFVENQAIFTTGMVSSKGFIISNNIVRDSINNGIASRDVTNILISNNNIYNNGNNGILVDGGININLTNNICDSCKNGIKIYPTTAEIKNIFINSNNILNSEENGILLLGGNKDIAGVSISSNNIRDNDTGINANSISIADVIIKNNCNYDDVSNTGTFTGKVDVSDLL